MVFRKVGSYIPQSDIVDNDALSMLPIPISQILIHFSQISLTLPKLIVSDVSPLHKVMLTASLDVHHPSSHLT